MPEGDLSGRVTPRISDHRQILQELLNEIREFSSSFSSVASRIEDLPPPLNAIPQVSLRHAEEMRHGTDHLIHALWHREEAPYAEEQLWDARSHILNLLPDFYMHVNGYLLRWCADALTATGMLGKSTVEEERVEDLIQRYAEARAARTGRRLESLRELRSLLEEVLSLAPRILATTQPEELRQQAEIDKLGLSVRRARIRLWVAALSFFAGALLWMF